MRCPSAVVWLLPLGTALAGCADLTDRGTAVVRDSAGVTIIEHGRVDLDTVPQWGLRAIPEVSVGTIVGDAAYQFDRIRDARRVQHGAIAVIDRSRTLRLFDSDGTHVWTAGGPGDGPGELGVPYIVREVPPDSLLVWDAGPNRLNVFGPDGRFMRSATLRSAGGNAVAWGLSDPRSLLMELRRAERTTIDGHAALVHPSDFYLVDLDARITRELGRRIFVTNFQEVDENGAYSPAIFATSAVIAPAPDGLWYGDTKEAELRQEVGPNRPSTIMRWGGANRTVSDNDVEALLATWRDESADDPAVLRFLRAYGESHPRAERFPAYERLLIDRIGRLWVQEFVKPHDDDGRRQWLVFAADGTRILARMTHEAALEPYDIGDDWLLGVARDALDVESVRVYGLDAGS